MGQRANLILVQNKQYDLFYSHWAANTLPQDLFWGPDFAMAFIKIQRRVDESGWLDDIWAEGGAVVDQDTRQLLLFGGEDIRFDVPLRRVYIELLGKVWKDWRVQWAHEGIADLADYVGYPRDRVISKKPEPDWKCNLSPPEKQSWTDIIGSVASPSGLRLFPLAGNVRSYLSRGWQLAEAAENRVGLVEFDFAKENGDFPTGGFHLDLARKELEFWAATSQPSFVGRLTELWPGWRLINHQDCFEFQLERTRSAVRLRIPSRVSLLARLREILLWESKHSPVETVMSSLTKTDFLDVEKKKLKSILLPCAMIELRCRATEKRRFC